MVISELLAWLSAVYHASERAKPRSRSGRSAGSILSSVTKWPARATVGDLELDGELITHVSSGRTFTNRAAVALMRRHPRPIAPHIGWKDEAAFDRWQVEVSSSLRVLRAVGLLQAWLEENPD